MTLIEEDQGEAAGYHPGRYCVSGAHGFLK